MVDVMQSIEDIVDELRGLADRLSDTSIQLIGRALETPEEHERHELATLEKRVGKARRAVEKAIHELET
jgi:uncharacterized protein Yka (UPF0111/DUF47 family)